MQKHQCLPYRAMVIRYVKPELQRGTFAAFVTHGEMGHGFDGQLIVKMVAGLPGDWVEVKQDVLYVNGKRIGGLDLLQKLGKPPGALDRVATVPPGFVFVIGTEPRSYDGRYWGFLPDSEIIGSAYPLDPFFSDAPPGDFLAHSVLGAL